MWMFTTIGFFSAVQKKDDPTVIQVRARVREDLVRLKEAVPGADEILELPNRDYPYRVYMCHLDWAGFCAGMAEAIDYPNFKDEVKKVCGYERGSLYMGVWTVMHRAEDKLKTKKQRLTAASQQSNFDLLFGDQGPNPEGYYAAPEPTFPALPARTTGTQRRRVVQHGAKQKKRNGRKR
jgi:hypothetical protein